ncbi:gTPase Era [Clostridium sp. CAG:448]|nr:gTPase Era [Clostridium sp. CAG:448]
MSKTGFIAIVGRPNVGKSTLMNTVLGEKVAIVSSKPQTTRNRILGILTRGENQYVFIDTPGIHRPKNALGDYMVRTANASMQGADAVILVADAGYEISPVEQNVIAYLKSAGVPGILALNKVDLYRREQIAETIAAYAALHSFAAVVPICAKNGKNVDELLDECTPFLSPSDWFFPEDAVTDQPERQVAAEIIREKLLRTLNKEVPHGVAVVIDRYVDEKSMVSIYATIYCEKPSHKGIIVGKGGEELKRVGSYARADLEKLLGVRVYLNLWVKVKENWRDSARGVTDFGYSDE